jgi:hypothetical protein
MDVDKIHEQMLQIIEDKKTLNNFQLELKWAQFLKEYPMIFIALQSNEDIDLNMLQTMINKIKMVNSGRKELDVAEKEFGELMADKYIYDKFEKPSESQLRAAYEIAKQKRTDTFDQLDKKE